MSPKRGPGSPPRVMPRASHQASNSGVGRLPSSRRTDGIPFADKEYGSVMPFSVVRALRSPGLGSEFGKLEQERVEGSPVVTVIGTAGDSPGHWLAAGQALEALLLGATTRGLAAAYLNQALEIPILRRDVTNIIDRGEHPQMILRLGYPVEGVGHPAPRRDLEDVLLIVD